MKDPVMIDLAAHFADQEKLDAQQRALDEWLDNATPSTVFDALERMSGSYTQRLCLRLLGLMNSANPDPWKEAMRDLFIELLSEEAEEENS